MAGLLDEEELLPFFGNPNIQRQGARARALAAQRDVNTLRDPRTYAAISGLLGQAPDELGFSVLNPAYEDIQRVGRPAFAVGTALGVAPMMRGMNLAPRPAARKASGRSQRGAISHPFLKPSVAFSSNPYAGLSGPDASNMTRYLGKLKDPNFANRELMREQGQTQSKVTSSGQVNLVTPEDWFRAGNPLVATAGDTSLAGKKFTNVEGVPLANEVDVQGGFQHTINNLSRGSDNAWASMEGNAQGKQNHFDKVAIETGQIPRSVFLSMNPKDSADFSSPITEMIMGQLRALPPSKQAEALANQMMRSKFPDFVGVNHPEALDQLMGRGGYSPKGAGAMRKQFAFASKQKSLDSLGWPSYEDARNSITHPLLAQAKVGDSGLSSFLSNPGAELIQDSGHNSYNRGISGTDAQSLAVSMPAKNMFPTLYKASQNKTNKAGKKFTHDQIVGDIKMGHYYQMPDQQWLDQIMPVYEQEIQRALLTNGLLSAFP
jgi:hypothetical protein